VLRNTVINTISDDHPFTALKEWDNFLVVDNVTSISLKEKRFVFVPYVPVGRFQEALDQLDISIIDERPEIIFAHQEFYGAQMGAIKSINGDKWSDEAPFLKKVVEINEEDYYILN
jgi:hypothetical protein